MRIELIAADSMGTRSMATCIETPDLRVLIDPGVALAPKRYGLPPHPLELQKMQEGWDKIKAAASRSDVLVVTHYHYDHHSPEEPWIYEDKVVLLKHPSERINRSQKERASRFLEKLGELPEKIEYCDGRRFEFGGTELVFSPPVFHGTNPRLGYVTQVAVRHGGRCFLFSSDVEGPGVADQAEFIIQTMPEIAYIDGPMSYMLGYRYSRASFESALENLKKILRLNELKTLIIDHHLLRDVEWRRKIGVLFDVASESDKKLVCAAEFADKSENLLEAKRKELYERYPVD